MQGGSTPLGEHGRWSAGARVVGPGSSSLKYDILTALLTQAAQGEAVTARLSLRLALLITARFNWRSGRFAVGLREMARLWGVTERTAKREIAAMRSRGWLTLAVPSARGRVAAYQVEFPAVLEATMAVWPAVGPDFEARMTGAPEPVPGTEPSGNVVPLRGPSRPRPDLTDPDGTGWTEAARRLRAQDAAVFEAWFAPLCALGIEGGVLHLGAPSRFLADYVTTHFRARLLAAVVQSCGEVRDVSIDPV